MAKLTYADVKAQGTPYDEMIRQAADANGISYDYLHKKIFNESSFNPNAVSPTGPRGLGQFTKATGRAYGLVTDEDFFDPVKSINASAALTRDLLGTYKGDYLKAALAYNQGNGRLGAPQLAALDRGDFSKIAPEGKLYMEKLLDVAGDSPSRKWFTQEGSPKLTADSIQQGTREEFARLTQGISQETTVERGAEPTVVPAFNLKEGQAPQVQKSFREMELDQNGPEKGLFEGTGEAIKSSLATSWAGQFWRNLTEEEHDPLEWIDKGDTSNWSDEDFENIRKEGVDPQYFSFLYSQTKGNRDLLPNAIAMAKENMAYDQRFNKTGTGAQIVGGIAGAVGDPTSYIPVPGSAGASFAGRIAKQAAATSGLAVASEGIRSETTGIEAHYAEAAIGGAVMGGVLGAVLGKAMEKPMAPLRPEMPDADLEAVLARHGEGALKNDIEDPDYFDALQGGPKPARPEGPEDSIEAILARHGESYEANEFDAATTRLEVREASRKAGQEDQSRQQWNSDDLPDDYEGVAYVDHSGEPGAVRLRDGSVLSRFNPLNPKTLKLASSLGPERSALGIRLGDITEIGLVLNRSEDPAILDIGSKLFRSTVGTQSGSNGRFAATASDIIERLKGEDHIRYGKLMDITEDLLKKDPKYALAKESEQSLRESAYRRVAEAIEDKTGKKAAQLSAQESALKDLLNEHFSRKFDALENPAQFGNPLATPVLGFTRHEGSYIPNVYDDAAKALHLARFGDADGLQNAIVESWMASYASRPEVRARIDKMIQDQIPKPTKGQPAKSMSPDEIRAAVEQYARNKAYGISHTADFQRSTLIDDGLDSLVGAENNNFLEARNLFDSDVRVPMADGGDFAVNDLRIFDMPKLMTSYDKRVNGDIGIMAATGEGTDALKQRVLDLKTKGGNGPEIAALEEAVKILTGRARRDPDGAFGTALRSLNDLSFFSKNAYMAAQNFTEVAGMVTNGHLRMLMKGVPILREMTTYGSKIKPEQLREMHDLIFGRELDDHIRPRRQDYIDRLRSQGSHQYVAQAFGTLKFGTGEMAARSPFTKLLTTTSNYIADAGRQGALMDLVRAAFDGEARIFTPQRLKQMSITDAQFGAMKAALREHLNVGPDGNLVIGNPSAMRTDPRIMDVWRMGDKVADESILRPHKLSSVDAKALGPGWQMALQFKKFVLRSLNGRMMRSFYDATKNGKAIDVALQVPISIGLATGFYIAQRYVQAQAMPQEQRKEFLKSSFQPEMLAYAAVSRSNVLGSPLGVANFFAAPLGYDPAAAVRTSILPRGPEYTKKDHPVRYSPLRSDGVTGPVSRVLEQVPGAGYLGSIYQVGSNAAGLGGARNSQELGYMTGLYNGLRGLVPNDPVTQKALSALMQSQGMEYRQR